MDEAETLLAQARNLVDRKRFADALKVYKTLQRDRPESLTPAVRSQIFHAAYNASYRAYGAFHNIYDALFNAFYALSHLDAATPPPPAGKRYKLLRILSQCWAAFKEWDRALETSHHAEETWRRAGGPVNEPAYLAKILTSRAGLLLKAGRTDEALGLAERLLAEGNAPPELDDYFAHHFAVHDDPDKALPFVERGLARDSALHLCFRGFVRLRTGRPDEARADFESFHRRLESPNPPKPFTIPLRYFTEHARLLLPTDPPRATAILRRGSDLVVSQAANIRDLIGRQIFLSDNLPHLREVFSLLLKTDPAEAWRTLQTLKNSYLVHEALHPGEFTRNMARILRHDLQDLADLEEDLLAYAYDPDIPSIPETEDVLRDIPPGRLILDYAENDDKLVVFVLSCGTLRLEHLVRRRQEVDALAAAILRAWEELLGRRQSLRIEPSHAAPFRQLLDRCRSLLPPSLKAEEVFVVPSPSLQRIPFHLLVDDPASVTYLFNALLHKRTDRPSSERTVMAVLHDPKLTFAAKETELLVSRHHAVVVRDLPSLRDLAPRIRRLHIACHFRFNPHRPSLSVFELGDWSLSLQDIDGLDLAGADIVLMVCESGRTTLYMAENEHFDAARYFLRRKARHVLVTAIPVPDVTAFLWTSHLYKGPVTDLAEDHRQALRTHPSFAPVSPFLLRA